VLTNVSQLTRSLVASILYNIYSVALRDVTTPFHSGTPRGSLHCELLVLREKRSANRRTIFNIYYLCIFSSPERCRVLSNTFHTV
jgi:hypothetical protein